MTLPNNDKIRIFAITAASNLPRAGSLRPTLHVCDDLAVLENVNVACSDRAFWGSS